MGKTYPRLIALWRLFRESVPGRIQAERTAACLLPALAAGLALLLASLDLDWERRNGEASAAALMAEERGEYAVAARLYQDALADQPYDWKSRLALADLQFRHERDCSPALGNYLIALAGSPVEKAGADTARKMRILHLFR